MKVKLKEGRSTNVIVSYSIGQKSLAQPMFPFKTIDSYMFQKIADCAGQLFEVEEFSKGQYYIFKDKTGTSVKVKQPQYEDFEEI